MRVRMSECVFVCERAYGSIMFSAAEQIQCPGAERWQRRGFTIRGRGSSCRATTAGFPFLALTAPSAYVRPQRIATTYVSAELGVVTSSNALVEDAPFRLPPFVFLGLLLSICSISGEM